MFCKVAEKYVDTRAWSGLCMQLCKSKNVITTDSLLQIERCVVFLKRTKLSPDFSLAPQIDVSELKHVSFTVTV